MIHFNMVNLFFVSLFIFLYKNLIKCYSITWNGGKRFPRLRKRELIYEKIYFITTCSYDAIRFSCM